MASHAATKFGCGKRRNGLDFWERREKTGVLGEG